MTNQDTVWIVLPAYNEERALPKLLSRTADVMADAGLEPETAVPAAPVAPAPVVSTALDYGALIDDENFQVLPGMAYGKAGRDRTRRLELLESSADRSAPSRNGKGERSPRHLNLSPTREAQPTR